MRLCFLNVLPRANGRVQGCKQMRLPIGATETPIIHLWMRMTRYNRRTTINRIRERDERLKMIRVFLALLLKKGMMYLTLHLLQMAVREALRAQTRILLTCPHQGHPPHRGMLLLLLLLMRLPRLELGRKE